jgi:hypothetical protein
MEGGRVIDGKDYPAAEYIHETSNSSKLFLI